KAIQAEEECQQQFTTINAMVEHNQRRVLNAFQAAHIGDHHFNSTDGYGYDDSGRDALEAVYARVFGGEDALVRPQIVSGTHAISTTLFAMLRSGDELLYMTGAPYDTLEEVIGKRGNESGSLKEMNVKYDEVPLLSNGKVDYTRVATAIKPETKVIGIQRSKGYEDRPSFTIAEIKEMVDFVKEVKQDIIVF